MTERLKTTETPLKQSILKTLLYYDIFSYPLTYREIRESITSNGFAEKQFRDQIAELTKHSIINEYKGYYFLGGNWKVAYREQGNERANRYWKPAQWISRFIACFPFVQAVMVSGSLSKGFMNKDSDIDYFIITQPGRLWVCRTLLILFKKVFLFNSYKWFCLNYFIDSEHLEVEDKNLFTATELVTLKATYNPTLYRKFLAANDWARYYYPEFSQNTPGNIPGYRKGWFKHFFEQSLSGKWGTKLDRYFMKKTIAHWQKKFGSRDPESTNTSLKSRRYVSKQNSFDFQQYVLKAYKQRLEDFEQKYQVGLSMNGEMKFPESQKNKHYG